MDLTDAQEEYGVFTAVSNGSRYVVFEKDSDKKDLEKGNTYYIYFAKTREDGTLGAFFVKMYNAFAIYPDKWFDDTLGAHDLFPVLCYILLGVFTVMLIYQLHSNLFLKRNTEKIIECCINGKAIVTAMQYEDITLMNGRQRQRYYQGQVINEAARNTGDPLYFGS